MIPHTRRSHRSAGFTLLELISASAVMAMIALTLYTAMRIGFQARDRALSAVGPARAAEVAMDLIRTDLECALPPRNLLARLFLGEQGMEVPGTSSVLFYRVSPRPVMSGAIVPGIGVTPTSVTGTDPTSFGSVQRVQLLVRPVGIDGDGVLVRRVTRNLLAPNEPLPEEEILCRGVRGFAIRYSDGLQWYEDWDSTQFGDTLPIAVEVVLDLVNPARPSGAAGESAYHASRVFFLPCRDEGTLLEGES